MRFSVIASGSRANCTYLESGATRILIDCGLWAAEADRRLGSLGINPESLDAILVTHEHRDHILGVPAFSRRYRVPVFANRATAAHLKRAHHIEYFQAGCPFSIGTLYIVPFSISHDADDPVGFSVEANGLRFSQVTDLGEVTPVVVQAIRHSHALVIESNHDEDKLLACHYSWSLKQRISSKFGHLSNGACGQLLSEVFHPQLLHVVLAHISENSNTPDLARITVSERVGPQLVKPLVCGSPYQPTGLLEIGVLPPSLYSACVGGLS